MRLVRRWFVVFSALAYLLGHQVYAALWLRLRGLPSEVRQLSLQQQRRCRHYFRGALFLGAFFAAQRGFPLHRSEMDRFAHLAILSALFDDSAEAVSPYAFSAEAELRAGALAASLRAFAQQADPSGVLFFFWSKMQEHLPKAAVALFEEHLFQLFRMETSTRHWSEPFAKQALQKGGHAVLLFRLLLDPLPTAAERCAAIALGNLVQASDDIFDVWHDAQRGLRTPAHVWLRNGQWEQLAAHFEECWERLTAAMAAVASPRKGAVALAVAEMLAVLTRFCLQHYRQLAEKRGTLPWSERQALVLDMGRWSVRWRAVAFAFRDGFLSR